MFLKLFCFVLFLITEIPLFLKYRQAVQKYDFTRQTAIIILMIIDLLIILGIYKLCL